MHTLEWKNLCNQMLCTDNSSDAAAELAIELGDTSGETAHGSADMWDKCSDTCVSGLPGEQSDTAAENRFNNKWS